MPTTPRPCLDCGTPTRNGSRCPRCETEHNRTINRRRNLEPNRQMRNDPRWRAVIAHTKATHIEQHGLVCPGWERPPHPVDSPADLVGDHIIPLNAGGGNHPSNCGILCGDCNNAKGANP